MRAAFPGPLGGGESGTIRPRSGRCHGGQRLFARAGARSKSPAPTHGLSVQGWTESAAAGCSFSLATFSLSTQRESSSAAAGRRKLLLSNAVTPSKSIARKRAPTKGARGGGALSLVAWRRYEMRCLPSQALRGQGESRGREKSPAVACRAFNPHRANQPLLAFVNN